MQTSESDEDDYKDIDLKELEQELEQSPHNIQLGLKILEIYKNT